MTEILTDPASKGSFCATWICAGARFGDGSVLLGRPASERDGEVVQAIVPPGVHLPAGPEGALSSVGWRLATWKIRDEDLAEYGLFMPPREPDHVDNWGHDAHRTILWFLTHAPNSLNWFVARLTDAVQVSLVVDPPDRQATFASGLKRYVEDVSTVQRTAHAVPALGEEPIRRLIRKLDPTALAEDAEPERVEAERRVVTRA